MYSLLAIISEKTLMWYIENKFILELFAGVFSGGKQTWIFRRTIDKINILNLYKVNLLFFKLVDSHLLS